MKIKIHIKSNSINESTELINQELVNYKLELILFRIGNSYNLRLFKRSLIKIKNSKKDTQIKDYRILRALLIMLDKLAYNSTKVTDNIKKDKYLSIYLSNCLYYINEIYYG